MSQTERGNAAPAMHRGDVANVSIPAFLSCEGHPFPRKWAHFRRLLRQRPTHATTVKRACRLAQYTHVAVDTVESFGKLMASILRAVHKGRGYLDEFMDFCYLGLLAAGFVCGRHKGDPEWLIPFWGLMGNHDSLEFFDDGGWAVSPLDVFTYRWGPGESKPFSHPRYAFFASSPRQKCPMSNFGHSRPVTHPVLLVSVLGHHATFALSAALAIREAWRGMTSFAFHNSFYMYEQLLGHSPPRGLEEYGRVVRGVVWEASRQYHDSKGSVLPVKLQKLASAFLAEDWMGVHGKSGVQIWLCAEPFVVGQALRDAVPRSAHIIHVFDSNFWLYSPRMSYKNILSRFQSMHAGSVDHFVPFSVAAAAQVHYLAGVRLRAVWPGARYISRHYLPDTKTKMLQPRRLRISPTHLWSRIMPGIVFYKMLQGFRQAFEPPELAPFVVPHEPVTDLIGTFLQFDAVVFFPEDLAKVLFQEVYAANVPLFIPAIDGLLLRQFRAAGQTSAFFSGQDMDLIRGNSSHAPTRKHYLVEPFDLAEELQGHFKVWYWGRLADWANAPHVATFKGAADLLLRAFSADLSSASQGMRSHYVASLRSATEFMEKTMGLILQDYSDATFPKRDTIVFATNTWTSALLKDYDVAFRVAISQPDRL